MGEFVDMLRTPGTAKNNISGIGQKILLARTDKFSAFGAFTTPVVNPEDALTISGDHTFGVGDGFTTLEGDYKKNNWEGETSGDWGSNNKKFTIKAYFHGTGIQAAAAELEYANAECILLAQKLAAPTPGVYNQFGLEHMPARCIAVKWTTGTADAGSAGIELTFEVFQPSIYLYTGDVTLKA